MSENKIWYLSTCDTNARILKEWKPGKKVSMQDIKTEPILPEQIERMKELAGSYEALFSKTARKYRGMGLHEKKLTEKDFRKLILEEYTFLRRPVLIYKDKIYIGNAPSVVKAAGEALK